ncbi:MAG TPA: 16S rRNA (guanine(966)-N(2))-methyltransferase RsmD [Bryobacteraceae bacterium]|nr:16S rRNA (guanine(966)-N(2))-methyltransferase RsmD [Bryobacteraceae bacterium]
MRVIAGEFRSRRLQSMPGADVRPTPDRLRETLFNILAPSIVGSVFVDAYAGTGAVGIEALSRGARYVTFIEKNRAAAELIRANLAALGAESRARVIQGSATLHSGEMQADTIFIDPPYTKEREYGAAMDALENNPARLIIFQHSTRFETPEHFGGFERYRLLRQSDNALSFYRPVTAPS